MSAVPARVEDRDPAPVLALIERMATDPAADVEKLERLMAMHERLLARRAREDFAVALVEMKPKLPKIKRTRYNSQTQSFYAALEDIIETVDPILHEHGFAIATKVMEQTETRVTVRAELWHIGGHTEHTDVMMPIDDKGMGGRVNKTPLHATASAITYGKRYSVCAILNIATGVDSDGNLPPKGYSSHDDRIDTRAPTEPVQRDVLAEARVAARDGRDALSAFYKGLRFVEEREILKDNSEMLYEIADEAERAMELTP